MSVVCSVVSGTRTLITHVSVRAILQQDETFIECFLRCLRLLGSIASQPLHGGREVHDEESSSAPTRRRRHMALLLRVPRRPRFRPSWLQGARTDARPSLARRLIDGWHYGLENVKRSPRYARVRKMYMCI